MNFRVWYGVKKRELEWAIMMDQKLYALTKEWILEAGKYVKARVHKEQEVDAKANEHDVVTAVDRAVERFFVEKIRKHYPEHRIVGEEGQGDKVEDELGVIWYIDPIDGTKNFIHLQRDFAISVAIVADGVREAGFIYDVMADVLYEAVKGEGAYRNGERMEAGRPNILLKDAMFTFSHDLLIENRFFDHRVMIDLTKNIRGTRRIGAATMEFIAVAEGKLDGYIANVLAPWDIAAASIILNELGIEMKRTNGKAADLLTRGEIICVKPSIAAEVMDRLAQWKK